MKDLNDLIEVTLSQAFSGEMAEKILKQQLQFANEVRLNIEDNTPFDARLIGLLIYQIVLQETENNEKEGSNSISGYN